MSDLNISLILRFVDRATAPARRALGGLDGLSGRVRAGTAAMAGEFARWNGLLKGGAVLAGAYGLSMTALAASFVRPAAQFERFEVQLTTLEGSAEGAKRAMAWIEDFATRTPIELDKTVAAYAKLKAFGIDPTNGSMQALVDTMAATGGTAEQLDGLVLALGQAWSKGKLQGEEALQMLERGVPVWDLLAKKLGKTTGEVQEMASAGKLGRDEISLLVEALGEANKGASENMSRTWDGIISNLMDYWTKFQRMVMASGVFAYLKVRLRSFLDLLDRMSKDGRLQMWADRVAAAIMRGLEGIASLAASAVEVWRAVEPWIRRAVDALGGWENTIKAIIALAATRSILVIAAAFLPLAGAVRLVAAAVWTLLSRIGGIGTAMATAAAATETAAARMNRAIATINLKGLSAALLSVSAMMKVPTDPEALAAWQQGNRDRMEGAFRSTPGLGALMSSYEGARDWLWAPSTEPYTYDPARAASLAYGQPVDPVSGARALGGPVRAGQIYRWMEEGQEFFSPRTDGSVISTRDLKALRLGGGGSRSFRIGDINIHAVAGQSAEDIARAVRRELERLARLAGSPLHDGGAYAD